MKKKRKTENQSSLMAARACFHKFTLVEAMIAMAVTAVIIGASVALINVLQWGAVLSERTTRGTAIANNRIEQLRAGNYKDLHLRDEFELRVNDQGLPSSGGIYLRTTEIYQPSESYAEVTVQVTAPWRSEEKRININLATVIINPELLQEGF